MITDKKILIVGAGGFIGGHLVKRLLDDGNSIVATDIKPKEYWFQDFEAAENNLEFFDAKMHAIKAWYKTEPGLIEKLIPI